MFLFPPVTSQAWIPHCGMLRRLFSATVAYAHELWALVTLFHAGLYEVHEASAKHATLHLESHHSYLSNLLHVELQEMQPNGRSQLCL